MFDSADGNISTFELPGRNSKKVVLLSLNQFCICCLKKLTTSKGRTKEERGESLASRGPFEDEKSRTEAGDLAVDLDSAPIDLEITPKS